jgi:hypothetical protein
MFLVSRAQMVREAEKLTPPSLSRLPRQLGILTISQLYRPPLSVTDKALLYFFIFMPPVKTVQ